MTGASPVAVLAADPDMSSQQSPLLRIRGLNKRFRSRDGSDVQALSDIWLDVAPGSFVTIVGPSGCGKSTLLRVMAGIMDRTSGEVRMNGHDVTGPDREVGVVFQSPVLLPWRTVIDNILVPADIQRLDRVQARARAMDLLAMVGLAGFAEKYPSELSGGMQQRVGICRALVHRPSVLLMDEPFGALDAMTRETMNLDLLRLWHDQKITTLLVTHSIPESVFLADKVVVMTPRPGRIAEIIDIDLPRPRRLESLSTPAFGRYVGTIRRHFDAAGGLD